MDFLSGALKKAPMKISGSYILEGYDENLEHWLDSMRIDGAELGPVFRETRVKLTVQEPSKFNKKWSLVHREEGEADLENAVTYTFEPGKPFAHDGGGHGQKIVCTSSPHRPNIIKCQTEVKDKKWLVETQIMFTPTGLNVTVTNKDANVSMTIRYSRMADPWTLKKKKMLRIRNIV